MKKFVWLVRRELWENRSIWLVPLAMMVLLVLAYIAGIVFTWVYGSQMLIYGPHDAAQPVLHRDARHALLIFFTVLTALFNAVLLITIFRYLLHSLHGDRNDRSILFWRSLPISDTATVLSKLTVAMVVAPLATFVFLLLAQLTGIGALSAIATQIGFSASGLVWGESHLTGVWAFVLPALLIQSLWYLPFYGWAMMASAGARRVPFLWAAIPILVGGWVEAILFQTSHFFGLVAAHARSMLPIAFHAHVEMNDKKGFQMSDVNAFSMHDLATWIGSAEMWIGVAIGVGFVAATIAIRHYRAEDY